MEVCATTTDVEDTVAGLTSLGAELVADDDDAEELFESANTRSILRNAKIIRRRRHGSIYNLSETCLSYLKQHMN